MLTTGMGPRPKDFDVEADIAFAHECDCLIQDRFLAQARRTPDRIAVIAGERSISYGELQRLSSGWAARLQELGAEPNSLIPIVMNKGWEQIVAVLGILRSS